MNRETLPTQSELNTIWRSIHPDLPDFNFEWSAKMTTRAGTIYGNLKLIRLSVRHFLQFGIEETINTLKHEAAHYLAWIKYGHRGHRTPYFYYFLGMLGGARYSPALSTNMTSLRVRVKRRVKKPRIELDPETGRLKQI